MTPPLFPGRLKAEIQGAYWEGKEKRRERKCKKLRVTRYTGRPTRIAQLHQGGIDKSGKKTDERVRGTAWDGNLSGL